MTLSLGFGHETLDILLAVKPRDWMGVVVRGLGLWFIIQGILSFFSLVFTSIQAAPAPGGWSAKDYVIAIVMYVLVGLIAICTTETICGLLYPENHAKSDKEPPL